MENSCTTIGCQLYKLTKKLGQQEDRFQRLLAKAPPYGGQTELNYLDWLVRCYKKIQKARADAEKTAVDLRKMESIALEMMDHFEIPANVPLAGIIPGEIAFEIWYDDQRMVYCRKTQDLAPIIDPENIITIKVWREHDNDEDDDDDFGCPEVSGTVPDGRNEDHEEWPGIDIDELLKD